MKLLFRCKNGENFECNCTQDSKSNLNINSMVLSICFDHIDILFQWKVYKNIIAYVRPGDTIFDICNHCSYKVISRTTSHKWLTQIIEIKLEPDTPSENKINIENCYVNQFNTFYNYNFDVYYEKMKTDEDARLLKELIELLLKEKSFNKSKLNKFKDMLINNTDILGIFATIILTIIK